MRLFILISLTFLSNYSLFSQCDSVKIMFYNTENLFDCKDDSLKNDNEFLPSSKKKWNRDKFVKKINRIIKVIAANNFPDIIGFCEIENDSVLYKLTSHFQVKHKKYRIVHFESADKRGIDCALIYSSLQWDLNSLKPNSVKLNGRPTRDILSTTLVNERDTLALFVNHWPSRYGGKNKSEGKRINASSVLLHVMDSVKRNFPTRKIIAMGDFNDEPKDSSLLLLNAFSNQSSTFKGTIRYRGKWQIFDQFICSNNFKYYSKAFKAYFLLEQDKTYGGLKPFRTYYGPMYHNGFSDHLPIVLTFCAP